MESLYQNLIALNKGIELCLANRLILPALMLIYTGIDIVGSLERTKGEGTKASFVRWVDCYMLKAKPLECTALELYAARCGVLHTASAESDLSRSGKVRIVCYAWGSASSKDLQSASTLLGREKDVSIHVSDLFEAFRLGLADYFNELHEDLDRQKVVHEQIIKVFHNSPNNVISDFLDMFGNQTE
jgi:hypothetical protein